LRNSFLCQSVTSNRDRQGELLVQPFRCPALVVLGMSLLQGVGTDALVHRRDLVADEGRHSAGVGVARQADLAIGLDLGHGFHLGCVVDHGFHRFQIAVAYHHHYHQFR